MALPGPIASDSARKRVAASPDRIVGVSDAELSRLFHRLNNQLGIILANAELLESRLADESQRARAGQVVTSVLEAIATVQHVRRVVGGDVEELPPTSVQ